MGGIWGSSREDLQFWQAIEKSKAWPLRTNFVELSLKLEAEIKLRPICQKNWHPCLQCKSYALMLQPIHFKRCKLYFAFKRLFFQSASHFFMFHQPLVVVGVCMQIGQHIPCKLQAITAICSTLLQPITLGDSKQLLSCQEDTFFLFPLWLEVTRGSATNL